MSAASAPSAGARTEEINFAADTDESTSGDDVEVDVVVPNFDVEGEDEEEVIVPISTATETMAGAKGRITDYAILNVGAYRPHNAGRAYDNWKINQETVAVLIEVKPAPSRSLKGAALEKDKMLYLREAKDDLMEQAAFTFASRPALQEIKAIAASGPYWSNTTIVRARHFTEDELEFMHDPNYRPDKHAVIKPTWTVPLDLYSANSFKRFQSLRTWMKRPGVMAAPKNWQY